MKPMKSKTDFIAHLKATERGRQILAKGGADTLIANVVAELEAEGRLVRTFDPETGAEWWSAPDTPRNE